MLFKEQGWWALVRSECLVEMVDRVTVAVWTDDRVDDYIVYTEIGTLINN